MDTPQPEVATAPIDSTPPPVEEDADALTAADIDEVAPEPWVKGVRALQVVPLELRVIAKHGGGARYQAARCTIALAAGLPVRWHGSVEAPDSEPCRLSPMLPADFLAALFQIALVTCGKQTNPQGAKYRDVVLALQGTDATGSECIDVRYRHTLQPEVTSVQSGGLATSEHTQGYVTVEYFTNFMEARLLAYESAVLPNARVSRDGGLAAAIKEARAMGRKEALAMMVMKMNGASDSDGNDDDDDENSVSSKLKREFMRRLPEVAEGFGRGLGDGVAEKGDKWLEKLFGEEMPGASE
jgi:hypothetical protein